MPSEHDVRQRAVICQDCWFWKEMSCALASPVDGVCANKRPVQGRRSARQPAQAALVPLATGHALDVAARATTPVTQAGGHLAAEPFATDAPEATFTIAQLRAPEQPLVAAPHEGASAAVRATPPSFREIRAGRAAAASRAPIAEVLIPLGELDGGTLIADASRHDDEIAPGSLPCMDSLVERVRQRTAARLNRGGSYISA